MIFREYGTGNPETVILLHGGGLSWWNYRSEAELLAADYHIVLPILDGHADSDRAFTSIEDNAAEIIESVDRNFEGSVAFIGGLSLGAQILLEMLSQRKDICRFALVESAAVIPSKLTNALVGPAFGSSYGLIKNRSFARMQFKFLHMDDSLFEDYYRDTCKIAKADMIAFLKANTSYTLKDTISDTTAAVYVYAGEKENREIIRSVSAIREVIPSCTAEILPGLYHGEFSINHPDSYAGCIRSIINDI